MGFREDLESELVSSLPLREAIRARPDDSLRQAVEAMRAKSLGCAVIVDQAGKPSGLFTEQSLLDALTQNESLDERRIGDFTDPGFRCVKSSDPISRVWDAIAQDGIRFICVTDDAGDLIGVTGQRGIAEYVADCFPREVVVQRLGSTPWMDQREGA